MLSVCIRTFHTKRVFEKALNSRVDQTVSTQSLLELAKLALKNNYFEHHDEYFHHEQGTVIGAKFAPPYAVIFMGDFEDRALQNYELKPKIWWRYIDDIFMIWEHGEEALMEFFNYLNQIFPSIKFEINYSKTEINFLDVLVTRVGDSLKTYLYTKETDTHQFLEYSSCHPFHVKKSIPYSQTLRLRRICSDDFDFKKRTEDLRQWLLARGYSDKIVKEQIFEASQTSREEALREKSTPRNESNRDFLTLTYHPAIVDKIHQILEKNQHVLACGHEHNSLFERVPMISFKQPKSLK